MADALEVYLEVGSKRTFAGALDWPGWCRSGRTAEAALDALVAHGGRYRGAIGTLGQGLVLPAGSGGLVIAESLEGDAGTDFGVPSNPPSIDARPLAPAELERLIGLLQACWSAFDHTVAAAAGRQLRTGPRGGGRDVGRMVDHVDDAEHGYLGQLGRTRPAETADGDPASRRAVLHTAILDTLRARASGETPEMGKRRSPFWTPRYFVRRAAWHVLDHAWEIEDRLEPA